MTTIPELTTERLLLRPFTVDDAETEGLLEEILVEATSGGGKR